MTHHTRNDEAKEKLIMIGIIETNGINTGHLLVDQSKGYSDVRFRESSIGFFCLEWADGSVFCLRH